MPGMGSGSLEEADDNELEIFPGKRLPDEEARIGEPRTRVGVQLQNDSDEQESPTDTSQRDRIRMREELKAETGFASYTDFLEAYKERVPHLEDFRMNLKFIKNRYEYGFPELPYCAIYDVHQGDSVSLKILLRCTSAFPTVIHSTLRQPTAAAIFRIVLWDTENFHQDTMDTLGLDLKIQPGFFQAVVARDLIWGFGPQDRKEQRLKGRRLATNVFAMGLFVMTVARHHLPAYPDVIPVVLISGRNSEPRAVASTLDEVLPFENPALRVKTRHFKPREAPLSWMQSFIRLLEADFSKGRRSDESDTDLMLRSRNPLLHFHILKISEECHWIREKYLKFTRISTMNKEGDLGALFRDRSSLRRLIEDTEDDFQHLQSFKFSQKQSHSIQDPSSTMAEDELQRARQGAIRLETEIRDYLQLQTGDLVLRESIKSIELSNIQIEEAKRVKIFTILAFVYAPLNLATSIFGMNIEQLNGSGQHLWIFITTAVVTLAVTGGSWWTIGQINSYHKWRRRRFEDHYDGKTQFAVAVRLALIAELIFYRRTCWMFQSGAWWRIMVNHSSRLVYRWDKSDGQGRLTTGEWLSKRKPYVKNLILHDIHWKSAEVDGE